MIDSLLSLTQSPVCRIIASTVFIIYLTIFLRFILKSTKDNRRLPSGVFKITGFLPYLILLAVGFYQAKWQMFAFLDPDFLRVQRGFDPRGDLIGSRFHRGAIFDSNQELLAYDFENDNYLLRQYPIGPAAAHLIGYHHPIFGSSGLEKTLDASLMGRRVQSAGDFFRLLANGLVHRELRGNPVTLTIYSDLQKTAYKILENQTGAIVAMDPRDGSILAMVSSPSFDPNLLNKEYFESLRKSKESPFLNRAIHGLYPPGSTFKCLIALQSLNLNLKKTYKCTSKGFVTGDGSPALHDYQYYVSEQRREEYTGHGQLALDEALSKSCNVYFAFLSQDLGADRILEITERAGFNKEIPPAQIGLTGKRGNVPEKGNLTNARLARLAIGQDELLVTPLHLALVAGAIGGDGTLYKPKYLKKIKPEPWISLTDQRTATELARKLIHAVEAGTGHSARIPGIIVGGKTGTAENSSGNSHALFIGFAPWPDPRMAIAVVLEQGGFGGQAAAPAAAKMFMAADELGLFNDDRQDGN
ncbi:hypothetical protein JW979_02800 [bacterium]|nr:hypothetical protein [candidate division CSSED10-310 bacterium]